MTEKNRKSKRSIFKPIKSITWNSRTISIISRKYLSQSRKIQIQQASYILVDWKDEDYGDDEYKETKGFPEETTEEELEDEHEETTEEEFEDNEYKETTEDLGARPKEFTVNFNEGIDLELLVTEKYSTPQEVFDFFDTESEDPDEKMTREEIEEIIKGVSDDIQSITRTANGKQNEKY